ncbi:MAG: hypothetical protein J1F69_06345 [Clostridiales bacterium]|nr:hypothetical protein [Clostridiales bacterium]
MNKEQAQIYINNVGQKYTHFTKVPCYFLLVLVLAFLGGAVGFCRELPMVITVCALAAFGVVFTVIAVKKYMSLLRFTVVYVGILALFSAALICMTYGIKYFDKSIEVWECCVWTAVQVVVFVLSAVFTYIYANKTKPKTIAAAAVGCTSSLALAGASLGRIIIRTAQPDSDTSLLIIIILLNICICLLLMCEAVCAVRVYVMRKYGIGYKPEKRDVYNTCVDISTRKNEVFTAVYGFTYGEYTFYIYAKKRYYRSDKYSGKTRMSRNKYKMAEDLLNTEKIDGKTLAEIWSMIEPI